MARAKSNRATAGLGATSQSGWSQTGTRLPARSRLIERVISTGGPFFVVGFTCGLAAGTAGAGALGGVALAEISR